MVFRIEEFSANTGLHYDKKAKTFWGTAKDYPVFLHYERRRSSLILSLTGKFPGDAAPPELTQQFEELKKRDPLILSIGRQERRLIAQLLIPAQNPAQALAETLSRIADFARQQQMLPCCAVCGRTENYAPYLVHTDGYPICGHCKGNVEANLEAENQRRDQRKGRLPGLILGAVIGAALVFGTTWMAAGHNRLSILTAVGGVMLGMLLMHRLGKKVTVPAAALCCVLCLIASVSALFLHSANEIAKVNRKNYDFAAKVLEITETEPGEQDVFRTITAHQTAGACLRDLPELLENEMYAPVKRDLKDGLFWGFLSVLGGTAFCAYPYLSESRRRFALRKPVAS